MQSSEDSEEWDPTISAEHDSDLFGLSSESAYGRWLNHDAPPAPPAPPCSDAQAVEQQ